MGWVRAHNKAVPSYWLDLVCASYGLFTAFVKTGLQKKGGTATPSGGDFVAQSRQYGGLSQLTEQKSAAAVVKSV